MPNPKWITIVGLALELIGVAIIWRFGWPQPQLEGGSSFALEDDTPMDDGMTAGQERAEIADRRPTYAKMSVLGFSLLAIGLVLQGIAQFREM
jgi:hypothetical protein